MTPLVIQHEPMFVRRMVIVPARMSDVYQLADNLRDGDRDEAIALGTNPRIGIRNSFRRGILNKSCFIDGELAAMWGLCGTLLGDEGHPWLMTTPVAERLPVQFLKVGRCAIAEMLQLKPLLSNVVPASYTKAVRLVKALGFTIEDARPIGPQGVPFHAFHMRRHHGH